MQSSGKGKTYKEGFRKKTETGLVPLDTIRFAHRMGSVSRDDRNNAISTTLFDSVNYCCGIINL